MWQRIQFCVRNIYSHSQGHNAFCDLVPIRKGEGGQRRKAWKCMGKRSRGNILKKECVREVFSINYTIPLESICKSEEPTVRVSIQGP